MISSYFGLLDNDCFTLEDIGKEMGVTRERVRQILAKALRKLKQHGKAIQRGLAVNSAIEHIKEEITRQTVDAISEDVVQMVSDAQVISGGNQTEEPVSGVLKLKYVAISELELSVRGYNSLRRAGINTVFDLLCVPQEELCRIRNMGQRTITEVENKLNEYVYSNMNMMLSEAQSYVNAVCEQNNIKFIREYNSGRSRYAWQTKNAS